LLAHLPKKSNFYFQREPEKNKAWLSPAALAVLAIYFLAAIGEGTGICLPCDLAAPGNAGQTKINWPGLQPTTTSS
jgi:hypothetical protein